MNKKALQAAAAYLVYESNYNKEIKLKMIDIIEHSTEERLLYLIEYGAFNSKQENISERSLSSIHILLTIAKSRGKALYTKFFGEAIKVCDNKEGKFRKECIKNYKVKALKGKILALKREMPKCIQTNRPEKCRKRFMKHIKSIEKKILKINK